MGLELNPSKCEWSWLDPKCKAPCPIRLEGVPEKDQVKLVPHDKIEMLGVPLGSKAFTCDYVKDDLLTRLKPVLERLEAFEDTQAACYLLRVSFSIVRATHYMRTTPLDQWKEHAETFDTNMKKTVENILAVKMTKEVRKQMNLTPKLGGLGFRRTVDHANFAFSASWHEARDTAKEQWDRPDGVPEEYASQSAASFQFDSTVHAELVAEMEAAGKPRESQRLQRLAQPHAGGFVTALPSRHDGYDTILKPRTFRTAVYYRMAFPPRRDLLSFVQADHQCLWRPCHLLLEVRRPHRPPQRLAQLGGVNCQGRVAVACAREEGNLGRRQWPTTRRRDHS